MLAPRAGGFTLVELLVVLTIMVLLATAFPFAIDRLLPLRRVKATAQDLALELRRLQGEAARVGQPARIRIEPNAYSVRHPLEANEARHTLRTSTTIEATSFSTSQPISEIALFPDGSTSGGMLRISDSGRHAAVQVSGFSGRIRVVE